MGCDIHAWVQRRRHDGTYWFDWSGDMSWGRNYALFARMAGVRNCDNSPPPIAKPRGWPPEGSPYDVTDDGLHTPSWLTLEEFRTVAGEFADVDVRATLAAMEWFASEGYGVRIVFAFDN